MPINLQNVLAVQIFHKDTMNENISAAKKAGRFDLGILGKLAKSAFFHYYIELHILLMSFDQIVLGKCVKIKFFIRIYHGRKSG